MEKEKNLKEFIEGAMKEYPMETLSLASKLIELEAIEQYLNVVFGIELDIKVKPAPKKEGRWFGKGVIEKLSKNPPKK